MTARVSAICLFLLVLMLLITSIGCAGRPALLPNPDPALNRTSAELAADAAKRFPYPADAPHGGEAVARAQVGYTLNRVEVVNLTDEPWEDVEVWVNQTYVIHLPLMQPRKLKIIPFQALFDAEGKSFPTKNMKTRIETVQIHRNGTVYDVPVRLGD